MNRRRPFLNIEFLLFNWHSVNARKSTGSRTDQKAAYNHQQNFTPELRKMTVFFGVREVRGRVLPFLIKSLYHNALPMAAVCFNFVTQGDGASEIRD